MNAKSKQVLEALRMQPLSEEEKASRHILGRLYGPIATCREKTRNGRGYNRELWEKALADDIFKEKLATKSLFLELGHPADREETDMKCICACIPEMPKIVDGDLYAYVDILDTPNGKLLKTLCDYGFVPGISSRGSGDIMANDEVDPETFFLETWDIVQLPAVKKARLSVCESFDGKKPLKAVLTESFDAADGKDKEAMKEALNNLDIKLDETTDDDIPIEDPESETAVDGMLVEGEEEPIEQEPEQVESEPEETTAEPTEDAEPAESDDLQVTPPAETVSDLVKELQDYDGGLSLEWKPITVDGTEYEITALTFDDGEDGKLVVNINYNLPEAEDNTESPEETEASGAEEGGSEEASAEEETVETEEAGDAGDEEMIENLKEMVRQKDALESEVRELKNQKTVSDAEVNGLKEELAKYKTGFVRVSEIASKAGKLEKEAKSLNERLSQKESEIQTLKTRLENHISLTESVNASEAKVKALTEKLASMQSEAAETERALNEKLSAAAKRAKERGDVAVAYKGKYDEVIKRYVASKADMLGVRPTDITGRLDEGYSLDDIDKVCSDLLTEGRPQFSLGYGRPAMRVNESKESKKTHLDPDGGYDIDDDLLVLAGLK